MKYIKLFESKFNPIVCESDLEDISDLFYDISDEYNMQRYKTREELNKSVYSGYDPWDQSEHSGYILLRVSGSKRRLLRGKPISVDTGYIDLNIFFGDYIQNSRKFMLDIQKFCNRLEVEGYKAEIIRSMTRGGNYKKEEFPGYWSLSIIGWMRIKITLK